MREEQSIEVKVKLRPRTLWSIADTAERLGVSNSDVLEMRLAGLRPNSIEERIRELHAMRYCDADIAAETGFLVGTIASIRRSLKLPANRRYGKRTNA